MSKRRVRNKSINKDSLFFSCEIARESKIERIKFSWIPAVGDEKEKIEVIKERSVVSDELGRTVRRFREEKGYSLAKLAKKTNTTASYIHKIEVGARKRPSIIVLQDIADGLDVGLDVLYYQLLSKENKQH